MTYLIIQSSRWAYFTKFFTTDFLFSFPPCIYPNISLTVFLWPLPCLQVFFFFNAFHETLSLSVVPWVWTQEIMIWDSIFLSISQPAQARHWASPRHCLFISQVSLITLQGTLKEYFWKAAVHFLTVITRMWTLHLVFNTNEESDLNLGFIPAGESLLPSPIVWETLGDAWRFSTVCLNSWASCPDFPQKGVL